MTYFDELIEILKQVFQGIDVRTTPTIRKVTRFRIGKRQCFPSRGLSRWIDAPLNVGRGLLTRSRKRWRKKRLIHIARVSANGLWKMWESVCENVFTHEIGRCSVIWIRGDVHSASRVDWNVFLDARTLLTRTLASRRRRVVEWYPRGVSAGSRLLAVDDQTVGLI